jgi:nucleoside-diphosphate-sugar epimerase
MSFKGLKILVTGGAGVIGSNLVKSLVYNEANVRVTALFGFSLTCYETRLVRPTMKQTFFYSDLLLSASHW